MPTSWLRSAVPLPQRTMSSVTPLAEWPSLFTRDSSTHPAIALPLGGIGTGTISLGARGELRDWEIVNRPAKGFRPRNSFFALRVQQAGKPPLVRLLEGPHAGLREGPHGSPEPLAGLPRFRHCEFEAAYPLGQVSLTDPDVPVCVRLQAFNPLVPGDALSSGLPVAVLRYEIANPTDAPLEVSLCASLTNFVGHDGTDGEVRGGVVERRSGNALQGLLMRSTGVAAEATAFGTLALAAHCAGELSSRTASSHLSWNDTLRDFWDDFADGRLDERARGGVEDPTGSLALTFDLPAQGRRAVTFLIAWHFPNRRSWDRMYPPEGGLRELSEPVHIGNHYATKFADAWDVASHVAGGLPELEERTVSFVRSIVDSDLPAPIKDAASSSLATLRSTTCFRAADGRFYGWEGSNINSGCCFGNALHVWNYEHATAYLFPELSRSMRDTELNYALDERGLLSTRIMLPLDQATGFGVATADGQAAALMRLYRDWQLSGDDEWLVSLWPHARRALEFFWIDGGWDADRDGVAEGCLLNTYDVEFFGPNPLTQFWYLGALKAMVECAEHLGERELAGQWRDLYERGRAWTDEHLFNGEYYEQQVVPQARAQIADGLYLRWEGAVQDSDRPELQLESGCLTDQLAGQVTAQLSGLGDLADVANSRAAAGAVYRHNRRPELHDHFNPMRVYASEDDAGLLIATWPHGGRPDRPFPYADEIWPGAEYTAAMAMLFTGLIDEALTVVADTRRRHDGRTRNPFNETEAGNHYVRSLSAWGLIPSFTGFRYSAVTGELVIRGDRSPGMYPWATGYGSGSFESELTPGGMQLQLSVAEGGIAVQLVTVSGVGQLVLPGRTELVAGSNHVFVVAKHR
jgi:non-lysosomal glucosylceramidase